MESPENMSLKEDKREAPYNQRFGDIYFSPEDGVAETRHVFLQGNNLPERWTGRSCFTIAETGFGTGLNFLAAWALFEETAGPGQVLDYISFEKYPLSPGEIRAMLEGIAAPAGLSARLDTLLDSYPLRVPGFHRVLLNGRVRLTLIFDDVNDALPDLDVPRGVDAWFLDGFAPSKNPEMWTDALFSEMARLSHAGTSAATFTVAGAVRRGLDAAGFSVEKKQGFGRKKDMTVAVFRNGAPSAADGFDPKRIAVVGGGLSGTACAYVLGLQGLSVTLFEKADRLAAGASGNRTGLYNPRFSALREAESDFYTSSYAQAVRTLRLISKKHDVSFSPCGALHLVNSPEKDKRFRSLCAAWGWHEDHARLLSAAQASDIAGIELVHDALYLPESGSVCPEALCRAYADGMDVRLGAEVTQLEREDAGWRVNGDMFDAVVLACADGPCLSGYCPALPVHTVRGQVSIVRETGYSARLKCALCYGGYLAPSAQGEHVLGATFQPWLDGTDIRDDDHRANLDRLAQAVPALASGLEVTGGRAALRVAAKDRFPVIGAAGKAYPGLFISTAHGSHGILSALSGAHLLSDRICRSPASLPRRCAGKLDPARFSVRA